MYSIPQYEIISHDRLKNCLEKHGYQPVKFTPVLWTHKSRTISFTLIVDDFGIKYVGKQYAEHLIQSLHAFYKIIIDWDRKLYSALTIKWIYKKKHVNISMLGYIDKSLHKFQHLSPLIKQNSPHQWRRPQYGARIQYAPDGDTTSELGKYEKKFQKIVETLLYYDQAVYLPCSQHSKPT